MCSSSLLSRNICSTFVSWDVLTVRRIIKSHEMGCVWCQDERHDIVQTHLSKVLGVRLRASLDGEIRPMNVQYVIVQMLLIMKIL